MKSISLIQSLLMLFLVTGPAAHANGIAKLLSRKFTQQNMAQSLKTVRTLAVTHKYKTGVAILLLSGLSGGVWYRNSCRRARAIKEKRAKDALVSENKRLAEEDRESAEKVMIEQKRLVEEREAQIVLDTPKWLVEEEQGDSQDLKRRAIEFDERLEDIEERVDTILSDNRENGTKLPASFERGLDICGFLTDDTEHFGLPAVKKILDQDVTAQNLQARTQFRKVAESYIVSMENILQALEEVINSQEEVIDLDKITDISPELVAAYDRCEDTLIKTHKRLKSVLCSRA